MKHLARHGYGILFVLALALNGARAAAYYVSPSGNDLAAGSLGAPFQTISQAALIMHPGDTCYIRAGVYRETVRPNLSGTSAAGPITFTAYNGEAVEVTGLDVLTNGWTLGANSVYAMAGVPTSLTDVFWNGQHVPIARYPAETTRPYDTDVWMGMNFTSAPTNPGGSWQDIAIIPTTPGAAGGGWNGATVVMLPDFRPWVAYSGTVSSSTATGLTITNVSSEWRTTNNVIGTARGFIANTLAALQTTNQWYRGGTTLYLRTPTGANPATQVTEGRTRPYAFDFSGLGYVQLKGIAIRAASLNLQGAANCLVQNCSIRHVTPFLGQPFKAGFNRQGSIGGTPTVVGGVTNSWEYMGVQVSGSGNTIDSCYIAESYGDGLTVWGSGNTVKNCLVEHTDRSMTDATAISVSEGINQVVTNTFRTTARSVLLHRALTGGNISYNDIGQGGYGLNDLGITYGYAYDGASANISYNWIHENYASVSSKFGPGMYFDSGSTNYFAHHNVIWNCGRGIFANAYDSGIRAYNNTMWDVPLAVTTGVATNGVPVGLGTINTLAPEGPFQGTVLGTNQTYNQVFSPFVDPSQYNFQLLAGGAPVGAGTVVGGITTDTPPDVGAYDIGAAWTAGTALAPPSFPDVRPSNPDRLAVAQTGWAPWVQLTWRDRASNEAGFDVYRRNQDDSVPAYTLLATVPAGTIQYLDISAAPGGFYDYDVRAVNAAGESAGAHASINTVSDGSVLRLYATDYDAMSGITNAVSSSGAPYIGMCDNNDWVKFAGVDLSSGFTKVRTLAAYDSPLAGRGFDVRLDNATTNYFRVVTFQSQDTGDWDAFTEQTSTNFPSTSSAHDVYFYFLGGTGVGNFQWFQFEGGNAVGGPSTQAASVRTASASSGAIGAGGFVGTTNNWIAFPYVNLGMGAENLYLDMATTNSGSIGVHADATNGPSLGTIATHSTGGMNVYQAQGTALASTNGVHDLYLVFSGYGAGQAANVRSYSVTVNAPPKGNIATPVPGTPYASGSGVTGTGGNVGSFDGGDWVGYSAVNFHTRSGSILFSVAKDPSSPSIPIEAHLDSLTGPLVGVFRPVPTGGWSIYQNQVMLLSGVGGTHDLYLKVPAGAGSGAANIASFTVNSQ